MSTSYETPCIKALVYVARLYAAGVLSEPKRIPTRNFGTLLQYRLLQWLWLFLQTVYQQQCHSTDCCSESGCSYRQFTNNSVQYRLLQWKWLFLQTIYQQQCHSTGRCSQSGCAYRQFTNNSATVQAAAVKVAVPTDNLPTTVPQYRLLQWKWLSLQTTHRCMYPYSSAPQLHV